MPNPPPKFLDYHRSLTKELHAVKDRIRDLVPHWVTDGEHKELALRSVLRRHLPESVSVGRGFIATKDTVSNQIDVLIVDRDAPTLFKDGDLMIVTPDAVRAVVEVKTTLEGPAEFAKATETLARNALLCRVHQWRNQFLVNPDRIWTGLFVYDADAPNQQTPLRSLGKVWTNQEKLAINCMALGPETFIRYWPVREGPGHGPGGPESYWHAYELTDGLAPSYFVGNLIQFLMGGDEQSGFAWFPIEGGKEPFAQWRMKVGQGEPEPILH